MTVAHARLAVRNPRTGLDDYAVDACPVVALDAIVARLRRAAHGLSARPLAQRVAALLALETAIERATPAIAAALEVDTGRRHMAQREIAAVTQAIAAWNARASGLLPEEWQAGRGSGAPPTRHHD